MRDDRACTGEISGHAKDCVVTLGQSMTPMLEFVTREKVY